MAKRVKIGDVLQILSKEGVSYAQVTHNHPEWGHLLRVFRGFYTKTPKDFYEAVNNAPQFSVFFPVPTAINQGLFSVVANVAVASCNREFPVFKSTNNQFDGDDTIWRFWDGENKWRVGRPLTEEEKAYPMHEIISAPLLIERIEAKYNPAIDDFERK